MTVPLSTLSRGSYSGEEGRSIARLRVPADRCNRRPPTFDNCRYMGPRGARTLEPVSEERQVDVAVVGGGPAGMAAALAASLDGASVTLIDEYAAPGGQIWRRRFDEVAAAAPPRSRALAATCARRSRSPTSTVLSGATVWAAPEPGLLLLTGSVATPAGGRGRARHRRLRPRGRVPRLDAPRRDDRGRGAGAGQGPGRDPRPARPARGCRPVPAARSPSSCPRAAPRSWSWRPPAGATGCAPGRGCSPTPAGWSTTPPTARACAGSCGATCSCAPRATTACAARRSRTPARTGRRPAASGRSRSMPSAPRTASRPRSSSPARSAASWLTTPSLTTRTCARASRGCSSPAR